MRCCHGNSRNGSVIPVTLTNPLAPISLNDCRNIMYSIFGISPVIVCDVIVSALTVVFEPACCPYVIITMVMGLCPLNALVQLSESCVVMAVTMTTLGGSGGTAGNTHLTKH